MKDKRWLAPFWKEKELQELVSVEERQHIRSRDAETRLSGWPTVELF